MGVLAGPYNLYFWLLYRANIAPASGGFGSSWNLHFFAPVLRWNALTKIPVVGSLNSHFFSALLCWQHPITDITHKLIFQNVSLFIRNASEISMKVNPPRTEPLYLKIVHMKETLKASNKQEGNIVKVAAVCMPQSERRAQCVLNNICLMSWCSTRILSSRATKSAFIGFSPFPNVVNFTIPKSTRC